jgi:ring-1,2-phenylacetyl-CoA epoxidase subunit PaaD
VVNSNPIVSSDLPMADHMLSSSNALVARDMTVADDNALLAAICAIPDPEIPVITLGDLGVVRGLSRRDACLEVQITTTYSGCPATESIRGEVLRTLHALGETEAQVRIVFSPAWSTTWISEDGRRKLRAYGIAPPGLSCGDTSIRWMDRRTRSPAIDECGLRCPRCDSAEVERLSEFGSTPCKALYRCLACREPFDYFKTL